MERREFVACIVVGAVLGFAIGYAISQTCYFAVWRADVEVGIVERIPEGKEWRIQCRGVSMLPTIPSSATCVCRKQKDYEVGDIVNVAVTEDTCGVYDPVSSLVAHRIVARDGNMFLLQGDNNPVPDGWYPRERILCKVVGYYGEGGKYICPR